MLRRRPESWKALSRRKLSKSDNGERFARGRFGRLLNTRFFNIGVKNHMGLLELDFLGHCVENFGCMFSTFALDIWSLEERERNAGTMNIYIIVFTMQYCSVLSLVCVVCCKL